MLSGSSTSSPMMPASSLILASGIVQQIKVVLAWHPGQCPDNLIQYLYSIKNQGNGLGRIKIIVHNLLEPLFQACQFCRILF